MSGDESRASARPERLINLAETTQAIKEALQARAGHLEDAWAAYQVTNAAEWRVDFGDLPGAVRAWAQTVGAIGDWTGEVGQAFLDADSDDPGSVHRLRESRLHGLLSHADRRMIEESDADSYVDWGDSDDPPPWLKDLQSTSMVVGHAGEYTDALKVAYVVGTGARARWSEATPALLGRFATPTSLTQFTKVLGVGAAGMAGLTAGFEQWFTDSGSLNYTDSEAAARAVARGTGTAGATALGGIGGQALAGLVCGPGAPVCAGGVIIVSGFAAAGAGDWLLDQFISGPGPAEHDPDMVREEILGVEPGYLPRDVPQGTWDVLQSVVDGAEAVEPDLAERHPYLEWTGFDPAMVEEYDLPVPWIAERYGDEAAMWARSWELLPSRTSAPLAPEDIAAIDRYVQEQAR